MKNETQYEFITGPGLIFIQDNLYADETEATNLMYLEFMDWTQEIFGENSDEFKKIQIDKSVWDNTKFSIEFGKDYFTHPDYGDYPVVGISLEQANLYSEWRTNRVAQLILIKKGLIKNEFTYSKDNYFTIDRYLNSDFDWIITKEDILVTEYKIPTKGEWELVAGGNSNYPNGIDLTGRKTTKTMRKYNYLYNTKEFQLDSRSKTLKNKIKCTDATCSVKVFGPNIYGLFDTIGNVSELISHDGLAKGGNWKNELADNQIEKDLPFEGPNAWTGFRNIASQKLFSVRNGS